MFGQTLYLQWKWNRDFLAFYTVVAFAAPLVILWIALFAPTALKPISDSCGALKEAIMGDG